MRIDQCVIEQSGDFSVLIYRTRTSQFAPFPNYVKAIKSSCNAAC